MFYFLFCQDANKFDCKKVADEISKINEDVFFVFFNQSEDKKNQTYLKRNIKNCAFVKLDKNKQTTDEERVSAFLKSVSDCQGCFVCRDWRVFDCDVVLKMISKFKQEKCDILSIVDSNSNFTKLESFLQKIKDAVFSITKKLFRFKSYKGSTQLLFFSSYVTDVIKIIPNSNFSSKVNAFVGFKEDVVKVEKLPKFKYKASKRRITMLAIFSSILVVAITAQVLLNVFLNIRLGYNFVIGGVGFVSLCVLIYNILKCSIESRVGELS